MKPIVDEVLLAATSALKGTILVVGDVMLDVYAYGQTDRISPEAPIPVMRLEREVRMLGGAGNVARNIAALGGRAILIGVVGDDESGEAVGALVTASPQIASGIIRASDRQTTVKRRFVVGGQQMLRVDHEDPTPLDRASEAELIDRVRTAVSTSSAVVLSDYGKGVLTQGAIGAAIAAASLAGVPILADPKHPDAKRYAGATSVTPNARELAMSTGMPVDSDCAIEAAARVMLGANRADFLVVTRSAEGMSYIPAQGEPLHLSAHKRDVFDVSGAGDTVIAMLALAIGSKIDPPVAVALANIAAGVVVGKPGTATCSLSEVEVGLVESGLRLGAKLQMRDRAARLSEQWRGIGLRVGFTNGCFDLLHPGHVSLLAQARARCDRLIVGLNSDDSVRRLKGATRPLQTEAARAAVLAALASVDVVLIFEEDTPLTLIELMRPSVLFKGADYTCETVVGADVVIGYGGAVELIDLVDGQSTTSIVNRIREDDSLAANVNGHLSGICPPPGDKG